ncbi:LTA synthase family protein [Acetivibrio cellulolyticus]|uniref:LTA synthase family protein n=1 Tax=Acetivibrio cellulolyticus TaxID=35830 RepID=UPI0001E2EBF7|nr:LTA synthase family protein [Acetivibrio cellulolyticus]
MVITNLLLLLILFVAGVLFFGTRYTQRYFGGVNLETILIQLSMPLGGTNPEIVKSAVVSCAILPLLYSAAILVMYNVFGYFIGIFMGKTESYLLLAFLAMSLILLFSSMLYFNTLLKATRFMSLRSKKTDIYEKYYQAPESVSVSFRNGKRNVIVIYLESMESTFASREEGGLMKENYISELVALAKSNTSFSSVTGFGGYDQIDQAQFTIGALVASTAAIPINSTVNWKEMRDQGNIFPGVKTLGDMLNENGYKQEFLCGSDASFSDRDLWFLRHGNYQIWDYYAAVKNGYIPEGYHVFWGHEDQYLYECAKGELTRLAAGKEPFNFTMLTVDTHHPNGYICDKCENKYKEEFSNVLACSSEQLNDFVSWIKMQPFYENTSIIITGDHLSMIGDYFKGINKSDRRIYNCFINCPNISKAVTEKRVITSFDMFPTVLACAGATIEGERLGLGTNIFSNVPTLAEELGLDVLKTELSKHSEYYTGFFS